MKTLIKTLIAGATLFLLLGQGEAIFAAPVLVPALWWAHQSSRARPARVGLTFLAALVMTEVGWFLAFAASRESQPFISIAPSLGFVGTILFFWLRGRSRDRGRLGAAS